MINEMQMLLSTWPIIDLFVAGFWFWRVRKAWQGFVPLTKQEDIDERALGATVIMGQLNAVITGASIIIAGIAAFVALGETRIGTPQNYHLLYAATWAVVALGIALYTMGTLPTRTRRENFVNSPGVALLSAMALFFSLFAGIRLLFGIAAFLLASSG